MAYSLAAIRYWVEKDKHRLSRQEIVDHQTCTPIIVHVVRPDPVAFSTGT
jgi:hypothetical protein